MECFIKKMKIKGGERIIDLGGTPDFWRDCGPKLDITIVNLPGGHPPQTDSLHHKITLLEGDACNVEMFGNMSFDIAFSNSVIEHVGDETKQTDMAREVRRLAPNYWIQTPSIWFPIEAHSNMPFWWFWPKWLQDFHIRRWRKKLPAWTEMVEDTRVLLIRDLIDLFPDGAVIVEKKFGFSKSYILYKAPE